MCSDVINAVPYVTGRIGRRRATCVCIGSYQEFNVNKDKCVCVGELNLGHRRAANTSQAATLPRSTRRASSVRCTCIDNDANPSACQPPKPTKTSHSATPSATKTSKPHHPHWRRVYDAAARNDLVEIAVALDCNVATEHVVEIDGEWTCRCVNVRVANVH